MWWTLARPAEEWTEFNLDNALWAIPAARMKARREHVIPLPFQAVKMLRTLQGLTGHRQHLFPGRDNPPGPDLLNAKSRPCSANYPFRNSIIDSYAITRLFLQRKKMQGISSQRVYPQHSG